MQTQSNSIRKAWRFPNLRAHAGPVPCWSRFERSAELESGSSTTSWSASSQNALALVRRSSITAGLMNGFFCFCLWLSLAFALWMARGWLGLLFGGQVLSAGTWLVKGLARKTQHAFSLHGESARQS
jgi:hypothetical protein